MFYFHLEMFMLLITPHNVKFIIWISYLYFEIFWVFICIHRCIYRCACTHGNKVLNLWDLDYHHFFEFSNKVIYSLDINDLLILQKKETLIVKSKHWLRIRSKNFQTHKFKTLFPCACAVIPSCRCTTMSVCLCCKYSEWWRLPR